jgi:hypothetical protein
MDFGNEAERGRMSGGVEFDTLASAISGLSVPGLKIRDLDEIKENMMISDCPCLMPHPANFITGLDPQQLGFGSGADKSFTLAYSMHYRLYFRQVTGVLKFFGPYADLVKMVKSIIKKFLVNEEIAELATVVPRLEAIGGVEDNAGNVYHGADIAFDVFEIIERII